jgi:hypothetical protein
MVVVDTDNRVVSEDLDACNEDTSVVDARRACVDASNASEHVTSRASVADSAAVRAPRTACVCDRYSEVRVRVAFMVAKSRRSCCSVDWGDDRHTASWLAALFTCTNSTLTFRLSATLTAVRFATLVRHCASDVVHDVVFPER